MYLLNFAAILKFIRIHFYFKGLFWQNVFCWVDLTIV